MSPWPEIDFSDLVSDETGGNAKTLQSDYLPEGTYPIVDQGQSLIGGYTNDGSRVCKSELPVIVFGDHTKCFKYIDFPFCLGADGTKVLKPKRLLDERYLFYAIQRIHIPDAGYSRHFKYLKEGKIPLPPLEEQKRIAAILDQADDLRCKRQRALDRLNQLGQAIFIEMFGSIDEDGAVPFEDVAFFQEGPGVRNWQFRDQGVKLINVKNIVDGHLDVSNTNRYLDPSEAYGKYKHFLLEEGDYVLASSGVTWGKIAEVTSSDLPLCLNTSMIRLRPAGPSVTKSYLRGFVEMGSFRTQIDRIITGSAQPNFGPSHLKQIKIPVPEIAEQVRFAERISELRRCANQNAIQCEGFERLFVSLQHRAFRGELTAAALKEAAA